MSSSSFWLNTDNPVIDFTFVKKNASIIKTIWLQDRVIANYLKQAPVPFCFLW